MKVRWKDYYRFSDADPEACYELVLELAKNRTPKEVRAALVEHAQDPKSPAHGCFTWDDEKAASSHRSTEAGHLIRSLIIIKVGKQELAEPVRALEIQKVPARRLVSTLKLLSSEEQAIILLSSTVAAIARLRDKLRRYSAIARVQGALTALDGVVDDLQHLVE